MQRWISFYLSHHCASVIAIFHQTLVRFSIIFPLYLITLLPLPCAICAIMFAFYPHRIYLSSSRIENLSSWPGTQTVERHLQRPREITSKDTVHRHLPRSQRQTMANHPLPPQKRQFHLFPCFPAELRIQIWTQALSQPSVISLAASSKDGPPGWTWIRHGARHGPESAALSCMEARDV